jgi:hypothetical protein
MAETDRFRPGPVASNDLRLAVAAVLVSSNGDIGQMIVRSADVAVTTAEVARDATARTLRSRDVPGPSLGTLALAFPQFQGTRLSATIESINSVPGSSFFQNAAHPHANCVAGHCRDSEFRHRVRDSRLTPFMVDIAAGFGPSEKPCGQFSEAGPGSGVVLRAGWTAPHNLLPFLRVFGLSELLYENC